MTRIMLALALAVGLAGCDRADENTVQGYVDANTYLVAAQVTARVVDVPVREGEPVAGGALLVKLDDRDAAAARNEAAARLAQADAESAQGQATLVVAERDFTRAQALRKTRVASESDLDNARKAFDIASASVRALDHQLEAARAALAQADWQVEQRTLNAPAQGRIQDIYFRPGEVAPAGRPLLSLLPAGELKVVFFVPQKDLARVPLGSTVTIACDGCGAPVSARVSYVSPQAEFTPPVIYSVEARGKLVFKLEARPLAPTDKLQIGQPVDITLPQAGARG